MISEQLQNRIVSATLIGALAGTASLGLVSKAEAATNPCPSVSELRASRSISAACKALLLGKLNNSVYAEGNRVLEVATYQKENGLHVDGSLGPITGSHILHGDRLHAVPSPRPTRTEFLVDKRKQVAYDIVRGIVRHEISVSTGTEQPYADRSQIDGHLITGVAHTPTGRWRVFRDESPTYRSALGAMPNARFFYQGYAVHEDPTSVLGRGSHGCVRIDHGAMPLVINDLSIGKVAEVVEHL